MSPLLRPRLLLLRRTAACGGVSPAAGHLPNAAPASVAGNASAGPPRSASYSSASYSSAASEGSAEAASAAGKAPEKRWSVLSAAVYGVLTGAVTAAGYATYAYTLEEVEQKANSLHKAADYKAGDDASVIDKLGGRLYSTAGAVAAKSIDLYTDVRRKIEEQVKDFTDPSSEKLLPDLAPEDQHVFTLVLDLNETLVYSDWKRERGWRTFKRPGAEAFLEHLAQFYEIVIYSDQLSYYVDPVCAKLDPKWYIRHRLSRTATRYLNGKHYRDLSKLNRDPSHVLYISGHALESCLQPENCIPIKPYKLETDDTILLDLIPFLEYVARARPQDIRPVLASYQGRDIATEFIERSREHQRKMQDQRQHGPFWRR